MILPKLMLRLFHCLRPLSLSIAAMVVTLSCQYYATSHSAQLNPPSLRRRPMNATADNGWQSPSAYCHENIRKT